MPKMHFGYLLGAAFSLILPVAVFAPKGLAPLFILSMALILAAPLRRQLFFRRPSIFALTSGIFAIVALLSAFWSQSPAVTIKPAIVVAAIVIGGIYLVRAGCLMSAGEQIVFEKYVLFGGLIGFLLFLFENTSNGGIIRYYFELSGKEVPLEAILTIRLNPANSVAAILFWPWSFAAYRRLPAGLFIVLVIGAIGSVLTGQASMPIIALICGAVVFVAMAVIPRKAMLGLVALVTLGVALMPLAPTALPNPQTEGRYLSYLPPSALHRLLIWRTTARHIKDNPIIGLGFDASRNLYDQSTRQKISLLTDVPGKTFTIFFEPIPLHPHNGILQVWMEMGILGAAALLGVLLSLIRSAWNSSGGRWENAACFGAITTAIVIGSASFGVWQNWWLSALYLTGSVAAGLLAKPKSAEN
jgi:exopolysaccharide production protein ExoQ